MSIERGLQYKRESLNIIKISMELYKPFLISKIVPHNRKPFFVCCLCRKQEKELWKIILHQQQKCPEFLKKFPNAKNMQLPKKINRLKSSSNAGAEDDKVKMCDQSTKLNLSSNLSIISRGQEQKLPPVIENKRLCQMNSTLKHNLILPQEFKNNVIQAPLLPPKSIFHEQKSQNITPNKNSQGKQQIISREFDSEYKFDPEAFQSRTIHNDVLYPPSELISKKSLFLIQSFQILSLSKPTIFLEEFREYLQIYRFDRYTGVAFESFENSQYKQRVRNTLFSLFKLHFTDKKKFVLVTADKRILINFCWRNDAPEISIIGAMSTFGKDSIYKDLINDSDSFKFKSEMCVMTNGQKDVLKVWRYIANILDEPIPFTVLSNHSFEGAYKYIPVIVDDIEQTKQHQYLFNQKQSKQVFKLRVLGYSLPQTLYAFCMAIGDKLKCIIEANVLDKSVILQSIKNTPEKHQQRKE